MRSDNIQIALLLSLGKTQKPECSTLLSVVDDSKHRSDLIERVGGMDGF